MKVLIVYGSTEGHTRDLCSFFGEALCLRGAEVTQVEAGIDAPSPGGFDVCFLAASLHMASYQEALVDYAKRFNRVLAETRSAFISVSLAAAGENPDDWAGLEECIARFRSATGWSPAAVHHAGGAIRYSQYDFFKRLALHYIVHKHGKKTVTSQDYDLTDYDALQRFAAKFAFGAATQPTVAAAAPSGQA